MTDRRNEPHVCVFYLDAFGFDPGQSVSWQIKSWPPTGDRAVVDQGTLTLDSSGDGRTSDQALPNGHYKLFWTFTGEHGAAKQKVFWVSCPSSAPTPTPTPTSSSPTPTPTCTCQTSTPAPTGKLPGKDGEGRPMPPRLRPIVQRGLAPQAEARYPSMDALLADLARVRRGRAREWLALGVTAAMVAIAAGAWSLAHSRPACAGAEQAWGQQKLGFDIPGWRCVCWQGLALRGWRPGSADAATSLDTKQPRRSRLLPRSASPRQNWPGCRARRRSPASLRLLRIRPPSP